MHVVSASDDNYAIGLMVLIASVNFHNPSARFTVLDGGMSDDNRARLGQMSDHLGCRIDVIKTDPSKFENVHLAGRHVNHCTMLRLQLPDLLPDDERVLYLDCDIVVLADLTEVWQAPLGDNLAAAVRDRPDLSILPAGTLARVHEECGYLGVEPADYINAGFLLMNLAQWRTENTGKACLAFLANPQQKRLHVDQSAVNAMCRGRVTFLNPLWNLFPTYLLNEARDALDNDAPKAIHFVVREKPWVARVLMDDLWWAHARRVAAYLPPEQMAAARRITLSRAVKALRYGWGVLVGKPKYRNLFSQRRRMRRNAIAPYLRRTGLG